MPKFPCSPCLLVFSFTCPSLETIYPSRFSISEINTKLKKKKLINISWKEITVSIDISVSENENFEFHRLAPPWFS